MPRPTPVDAQPMSLPAENTYDVIVIGARPIGYTAAGCARAAGLSVAAVNGSWSGASAPTGPASRARRCSARSSRSPAPAGSRGHSRRSPGRWTLRPSSPVGTEWVTGWNDQGQAAGLKGLGAELIRGHGRLDGHRRVAVEIPGGGTVALTARHAVVICTGSRTALPELAGLAEARPWTNREATDSHAAPGRLATSSAAGSAWRWPAPGPGLGCRDHPAGSGRRPAAPDGGLRRGTGRPRP